MSHSEKKLYFLLVSVHGLIRGHDLELGRDADTGGQTLYVVELARALGERDDVERVDLVTRRVVDPDVSEDYAQTVETLSDKVRIVRVDAGPEAYVPKEQLWDHLDNFVDNLAEWVREQPRVPDVVHSHYADAGYVGVRLAHLLAVPLVHTGHSLGRDKRKQLLAKGLSAEAIESTYNMSRRVNAEEETLANAGLVITSTNNEIEAQYGLYDYYDPECMSVIPPGTNLGRYRPPEDGEVFDYPERLEPFLREPSKPLVLALSRPDERKNIPVLLEAFAASERLREVANLLIIAGNRDDIRDLDTGAEAVLTQLLLDLDAHGLYGSVALPKRHTADDIPQVYRAVAAGGGVFVNPALTEPFGLTLLEAAASGLPLVATENGGPNDIISNCDNGLLVNPLDAEAIADALLSLLDDADAWRRASVNGLAGVRRHYTWQAHATRYVDTVRGLLTRPRREPVAWDAGRSTRYRARGLFTDIDQTLLGDADALHGAEGAQQRRRLLGGQSDADDDLAGRRQGHAAAGSAERHRRHRAAQPGAGRRARRQAVRDREWRGSRSVASGERDRGDRTEGEREREAAGPARRSDEEAQSTVLRRGARDRELAVHALLDEQRQHDIDSFLAAYDRHGAGSLVGSDRDHYVADTANDRRFFHPVDIVRAQDAGGVFDAVVIGSGNRPNPLHNGGMTTDYAFMIKDREVSTLTAPDICRTTCTS